MDMTPHEISFSNILSVRSENDCTVVAVRGELDIASAPALRTELLGLLGPHARRIVVDLSEVTFCDSSGLAVLVGASRRAWLLGGVLRLAAPAPPVTAVLRLTGLDRHFEIFPTVQAAVTNDTAERVEQPAPRPTPAPNGACATLN